MENAIYNYENTNIFDNSSVVEGELNSRSGTIPIGIQKSENYSRSAYIPVKPNTAYKFQCDDLRNAWNINLTFYDNTLTPIATGFVQATDPKGETCATSPSNAYCVSFNTRINLTNLTNIKFVEGTIFRSAYADYLFGDSLRNPDIINYVESVVGGGNIAVFRHILNGIDYLYIRSAYSSIHDIAHRVEVKSHYGNDNFNLDLTYLVLKHKAITEQDILLKNSPDDISPIELYGRTYIGGNHGIDNYILASVPAHGKTTANCGDSYIDVNGRKFYIVNIVDSNTVGLLSENIGTSETLFAFGQATGNLTKGSEVIQSTSLRQMQQLRPSTKARTKRILLDGKTVSYNILYKGNTLVVIDEYDCLFASKVLAYVLANKVNWATAINKVEDCYIKMRNNYTFTRFGIVGVNGCFITQNVDKARYGAISFDPLTVRNGQTLKLQVPKTKPFTHGSTRYDFSNMQDWNTNFTEYGWVYLNQAFWETGKFPDRWVEFICENDLPKHYASAGFIQLGDGSNDIRKANSNDSIAMNGYRKVYGRVFDQKVIFDDNNAKRNFEIAWFRSFAPASTGYHISKVNYEFGGKLYVNIDYTSFVGTETISIDSMYTDRRITVLEKSDNIEVLSFFASINGVSIRKNTSDYGYCTIILE